MNNQDVFVVKSSFFKKLFKRKSTMPKTTQVKSTPSSVAKYRVKTTFKQANEDNNNVGDCGQLDTITNIIVSHIYQDLHNHNHIPQDWPSPNDDYSSPNDDYSSPSNDY